MNKLFKLIIDNKGAVKPPVNLVKNGDESTLYIYDVIDPDWGVSALSVIEAIARAGDAKTLNVHINSPGGSVFEGRAIMAALSSFKGKTVAHIDSLCASAATSIALACNEVVMAEGSFFMIHNASCMAWGDERVMTDTALVLNKIEGSVIKDYTDKTGMSADEVKTMMNAETWMNATEALSMGFVDRISDNKAKPANAWNLSAYDKAPAMPVEPTLDPTPEPSMTQANQNRLRLLEI